MKIEAAGGVAGPGVRRRVRADTMLLIDGHSLFHRAYHALPPLATAAGVPTNAVYGFLTMLLRLLEEEDPAYLAVAFDRAAPTFRHEAYEAYKAHRPETAEDLRRQVPLLREVLRALRVATCEREGYEADDVLAALATRAAARGLRVVLVTGDRDLLQMVGPQVQVYLMRRGIREVERYDLEAVRRAFGVEPGQLPEVKALMGDASDNLPGVPGVGEKTALDLIRRFGSVAELYRRLEEAGSPRLAQALAAHREQVERNRELATLRTDVPLDGADPEELRRREPDREAVRRLFAELEFHSLLRRLGLAAPAPREEGGAGAAGPGAPGGAAAGPAGPVTVAADAEAVAGWRPAGPVAVACCWEAERPRLRPAAVVLLPGEGPALAAVGRDAARAAAGRLGEAALVGHDVKPLARWLRQEGLPLPHVAGDTALAAYLLDPTRAGYRLEDLARSFLGREVPPPEPVPAALAARAAAARQVEERLAAELAARGLERLYREVELPLVGVLADMEVAGVMVDPATLDELGAEFAARAEALAREIHALAGVEFNINSPQQLGEVLFRRLGLPAEKRTKTGFSTDATVLEMLAPQHPIAAKVLEYRHLTKLLGTYVEGLKGQIEADGRVRCTFQQTVAATGRLSSADPNLQNIPVREEQGRRLRRAFVAPPGHLLLSADYSQIELRVLAHMAGDEALLAAFRAGRDVHRATAAEVFGLAPEEVTEEQRDRAKVVNFGIAYGMSDFGLAQTLRISREEAQAFIGAYFARFPGVRRYMEEVVRRAREEGVVRTLFGRLRPLPDILSRNVTRRRFAERTAINTPIQGTAADIMKMAMVRVHRELRSRGLRSRLVLQVHDELILEVPEEELAAAREVVVAGMEGAANLAVPLLVDVKAGRNWYDLQPV